MGCQIFDRYNFLVMKILEISVKDSVKRNTLTALYLALIQIVSLIVVELLLIVFKVKNLCFVFEIRYFSEDPLFIHDFLFKIAHVISIAQMAVPIARIQFVCVVKIRHLKISITSRLAR